MIASSGGSVTIRQAIESDAAAWREIRLEALRDHPEVYASDYEEQKAKPMSYWEDRLRTQGSDGSATMFFCVQSAAADAVEMDAEAESSSPGGGEPPPSGAAVRPARTWGRTVGWSDGEAAVRGTTIVGMCGISRQGTRKLRHSGYILSLYVRPQWRRSGIAKALINACLDWAREQGVTLVRLGVVTTNTAAILLYTRLGFRIYGIEPQSILLDGTSYDELIMWRET